MSPLRRCRSKRDRRRPCAQGLALARPLKDKFGSDSCDVGEGDKVAWFRVVCSIRVSRMSTSQVKCPLIIKLLSVLLLHFNSETLVNSDFN